MNVTSKTKRRNYRINEVEERSEYVGKGTFQCFYLLYQIIHAFATYLDRAETEGATLKDATDPSSVRNAIRTNFVMVIDFEGSSDFVKMSSIRYCTGRRDVVEFSPFCRMTFSVSGVMRCR